MTHINYIKIIHLHAVFPPDVILYFNKNVFRAISIYNSFSNMSFTGDFREKYQVNNCYLNLRNYRAEKLS
jgi:hypothetical protein